MNELISVIMPAYNATKYIDETIQSVLNQTYTKWELVVVNDASTDNTLEVLRDYAEKDIRIKVIDSPQNGGCAAALNRALKNVSGEYVCWLSADDCYEPEMLEASLAYLKRNEQFDAVFSKHQMMNEKSEREEVWEFGDAFKKIGTQESEEPYRTLAMIGNAFNACAVLSSTAAIQKNGFFNEQYRYALDYDYMMRLAANARVGYLDKVTVLSRRHSQQVTREGNNDIDAIRVYEKFIENDEWREGLFEKAKLIDSREMIVETFKSRYAMYSNLGMEKEKIEVVMAMERFLNENQNVKQADNYCAMISNLMNEQKWNEAERLMMDVPEVIRKFYDIQKYAMIMANLLFYKGDIKKAKEILMDLVSEREQDYEVHYLLGMCYDEEGKSEEALSHYIDAVKYSEKQTEDYHFLVENLKNYLNDRYKANA